ncbi:unnamed protein product [Camellia sinensis]
MEITPIPRSDPIPSRMEFHKSRMARSSMFPAPAYSPLEESFNQDMAATVEKTMKKYADNLMRFLEGISSHLLQLELYCYNLDKSIREIRFDLVRDHGEADSKLKISREASPRESVQILRDKQELAETQKELAKLKLAQKESSSASHSQQNEERTAPPASDPKKTENTSGMHDLLSNSNSNSNNNLWDPSTPKCDPIAGILFTSSPDAHSTSTSTSTSTSPSPRGPPPPPPNPPTHLGQYLPPDSQYRTPQMQDICRVSPQPAQSQLKSGSIDPPITSISAAVGAAGDTTRVIMPPPSTTVPYSGIPQPGASRAEQMPYRYGGPGRTVQQQRPPQHLKSSFRVQPNDGYTTSGPHLNSGYMMYESEGGQKRHTPPPPTTSLSTRRLSSNKCSSSGSTTKC